MKKYSYVFVDSIEHSKHELRQLLNKLGEDGYRLMPETFVYEYLILEKETPICP